MQSKKSILFSKISFFALIATFFFSLFFFLPFVDLPIDISKGFILSIGALFSFFMWLLSILIDGEFSIPKDRLILFAFLIPFVFLIASFFSSSFKLSLLGRVFEVYTVGSTFVLFLCFFLSSIYFNTESKIRYFFKSLFLGASILIAFQILYIFFGSYSIFSNFISGISFSNLFGDWENFALFFGSIIITSLATLELDQNTKNRRIWISLIIILSMLMLMIVNNRFVWLLTSLFSILVFVYSVSFSKFMPKNEDVIEKEKDLPIMSFVVILISLFFLFSSNSFGTFIPNILGLKIDILRPSFLGTFEIAKNSLSQNIFFGTGPNTFYMDWAMWRPDSIILSDFWNYNFTQGVSFFMTNLVNVGILGFFSLFVFFIVFVFRGLQSMFISIRNIQANYFIFCSFVLSLYFWISSMFVTLNMTSLFIMFMSSGVFLGSLVYRKILPKYTLNFLKDPRTSFFTIFAIVFFLILSVGFMYINISKFTSRLFVSNANLNTYDVASLDKLERNLLRAIVFDKDPEYFRLLSQLYVSKFEIVANDQSVSKDTSKVLLQNFVNQAEANAIYAKDLNKNDYNNWINLGNIYSFFTLVGIEGSYQNALNAYEEAMKISKNNPYILLLKSDLEINKKDNTKAREFLNEALLIKPNYTDAIFKLAQIDTSEGKLGDAINQAERAVSISPNDSTVFFNLGILRYNNKDFSGAVSAFETAVSLTPDYMNARYFLGISYYRNGKIEDAKRQFEILNQIYPDNLDIKKNLDMINSGEIIKDEQTEGIENLPIEEDSKN